MRIICIQIQFFVNLRIYIFQPDRIKNVVAGFYTDMNVSVLVYLPFFIIFICTVSPNVQISLANPFCSDFYGSWLFAGLYFQNVGIIPGISISISILIHIFPLKSILRWIDCYFCRFSGHCIPFFLVNGYWYFHSLTCQHLSGFVRQPYFHIAHGIQNPEMKLILHIRSIFCMSFDLNSCFSCIFASKIPSIFIFFRNYNAFLIVIAVYVFHIQRINGHFHVITPGMFCISYKALVSSFNPHVLSTEQAAGSSIILQIFLCILYCDRGFAAGNLNRVMPLYIYQSSGNHIVATISHPGSINGNSIF